MVVGRRWVVKKPFDGKPNMDNFELVSEELPALQDGDLLYENIFVSVDPYQRAMAAMHQTPFTMFGFSVGKVVESKDPNFKQGDIFVSHEGWIERGVLNPAKLAAEAAGSPVAQPVTKAPDLKGLSPSHLIGACGMPGCTAYFGLLELCQPKDGGRCGEPRGPDRQAERMQGGRVRWVGRQGQLAKE